MNELLKFDESGNQTVSARELHAALGVGKDFSTWIKDRFEKYGFEEGKSYSPILGNRSDGLPGKPRLEYLLSISTAKEIAMVENNEQGRGIRQYLIKVEEAWNEPSMIMARALQVADKQVKALTDRIIELEPKAEFFDLCMESGSLMSISTMAKKLGRPGLGPRKIFDFLHSRNVLFKNSGGYWVPYQSHIDAGRFVVKQVPRQQGDIVVVDDIAMVTQKGFAYVERLVNEVYPIEATA